LPLAEARQQLGLSLEKPVIGFIGSGQGDLEIVLRALKEMPTAHLLIIGPARAHVHELAQRFGVAHRLWQTGFIADEVVGVYLACANVMCLPMADTPHNRGRLPNKLLDYMAAGRPTLATPVGDVKTILTTHGGGLLAEADQFGATLRALLENPALCAELGQQARRVAEVHFNWRTLTDQLEALYRSLL
jgi:glycosyltransferase involved in cell wall biosynthesis